MVIRGYALKIIVGSVGEAQKNYGENQKDRHRNRRQSTPVYFYCALVHCMYVRENEHQVRKLGRCRMLFVKSPIGFRECMP